MPQKSIVKSMPAPVGGVNARDSLAEMPATDAIAMDNWFPTPSYVQIRNGCETWATGLPGPVETVMAYNGFVQRKMFAVSGHAFYDVTNQGAVGATIISGLSNNRWQHSMFNAGGGNVLICVNGADPARRYDGQTQGSLVSTNSLAGGSLYVNGTYTNVPLTGGTGTTAKATVVVSGAAVTSVTITTPGSGYLVGDTLSASNSNLGGAGSGFSITVETVGGWSTTTISGSGLNPSNLITITIFKQRCWFIENNSMNVWYGGISAFQGSLTLLPLGQIFKMGGYLMQMATWTVDNVSGINDFAAFISSEGEVAIYQGYDPTTVNTWSLVGVFRIGRPIGRRCTLKYASDVLLITADGLSPLSKAMLTDRTQQDIDLTYKIVNSINNDVQQYNNNFGWQVIDSPIGNKLILNVPEVTDKTAHQWVMNTVTKAWCRFRGWNAFCWEIQQDSLYFGGNTVVYLADEGTSDAGIGIMVDCKPAFSYFDDPASIKRFTMARPVFQSSSAEIQPQIILNTDFNDIGSPGPYFTAGLKSPWNISPWNTTPWGGILTFITLKNWIGIAGIGYAASGRLALTVANVAIQWYSTDYMFETGGPI